MKTSVRSILTILAAVALAACAPVTPTPVPGWPTASAPPAVTALPTTAPTDEPTPTDLPTAEPTAEPTQEPPVAGDHEPEGGDADMVASADWGQLTERVIEAIGMRFDLPEGFQGRPSDLEGQYIYAYRDDPNLQVSVEWARLEPPMEPEAVLLPSPSRVLKSEPMELAWGTGRLVTLELLGSADEGQVAPVVGASKHLLVVRTDDQGRLGISIALRAPELDQLEANLDLLDAIIASVSFEG